MKIASQPSLLFSDIVHWSVPLQTSKDVCVGYDNAEEVLNSDNKAGD